MPTNFGEIAGYHQQEAARHYALAQAARDRGSLSEAEFHTTMGARWDEAAQEQKIGKIQMPSHRMAKQRPHCPPPPVSLAVTCLLAVERCVKRIADAIHHCIIKRNAPIDELPLR